LERFYDISSGKILIDGINISSYDLISYRKAISIVMEENILFKGDMMDNIKYGNLDANYEEIKESCNKANISELLEKENKEKITNYSVGERQRISLARAIIRDPKILLLDEITSALDKKSEDLIKNSLEKIKEGRTVIMIAHNLSMIENYDVIFVIENGEIIERGSHSELLNFKGKYFSLVNTGKRTNL